MNEIRDETNKPSLPRKSRRKSGAWKSGLVLTGLAGVVLGAGYLAGVNAPPVAQGNAQTATPQAVAQAGGQTNQASGRAESERTDEAAERSAAPATTLESDDGVVIGFDDAGNPVILRNDGSLQFGGSAAGAQNQFSQPSTGRRSRQFGGFSQQAPSFGAPMGRSRGS